MGTSGFTARLLAEVNNTMFTILNSRGGGNAPHFDTVKEHFGDLLNIFIDHVEQPLRSKIPPSVSMMWYPFRLHKALSNIHGLRKASMAF